jgi:acyl carrier protein
MKAPLEREPTIAIIRSALAECLALDLESVRPESRLTTELGVDSLDFIDLIFTLEKRVGVRIRENDLNLIPPSVDDRGERRANEEFLSPDAVSRALSWLPELATLPDLERVRPVDVWPLITVEALWRLLEQKARESRA